MYQDRALACSNVITADNMLYVYTERGDMHLVKPNSAHLEIVSTFPITLGTGEHFAHTVTHNGILYVRQGDALMAYRIK